MKTAIFDWIKLNYFSVQSSSVTFQEVDASWAVICRHFQDALESSDAENSEMLISIGNESITVYRQRSSGLKHPNQFLYTSSEISLNGRMLTVTTNFWVSDFFSAFFPIWKAIVFGTTIILAAVLISAAIRAKLEPSYLLAVFVLLLFNSVCWLSTYFIKTEVQSIERRILNIVNGNNLTRNTNNA